MFTVAARVNSCVAHLGSVLKTPLQINSGVCALYDNDHKECAVLEAPGKDSTVIFHCRLIELPNNIQSGVLQKILQMNFKVETMKGAWLALDANTLRLCSQINCNQVDNATFSNTVIGFMELAITLRKKLSAPSQTL